jgi:uncharacterized damage-inducible protein DinB
VNEDKDTFHRYLRKHRAVLLAKLDGLAERQVRWPLTPTGTNLLGLVKHVASVQLGYFGEVFGRPADGAYPWLEPDAPRDSDMFAAADESVADIIAFHRYSAEYADRTIEALDLDAPGIVPWWSPDRRDVTLQQILVHMAYETARHCGHADIVRELLDGKAGDDDGNLADRPPAEWQDYRDRLAFIAENAGLHGDGLPIHV